MMNKFKRSERGQGMVEYIIIVALIAAVVVAGFRLFGTSVNDHFTEATNTINDSW